MVTNTLFLIKLYSIQGATDVYLASCAVEQCALETEGVLTEVMCLWLLI